MKISVIIPTYNDPLIQNCLDSLFRSEGVDFEVIVIDDGSTTVDTKKITDKYPKCRTFIFTENKGPAVARNFGTQKANGDIVFFIDSDAQVYPDTLEKICNRFEKDSSLQGLSIVWSDEPVKNNFFNKYKAIEGNYLLNHLVTKCFGSNGSAIYKDIFLNESGFDENFKTAHAEDFCFGIKLFSKNYNIELDRDILMKNSYLDNFFFQGFKKYCQRAFLRAMVLFQTKNKAETSYNSKIFKKLYLLSGLIFLLLVLSFMYKFLIWLALIFYIIFFCLIRDLYFKFYKKYGFIFFVRSVILHYFYIFVVSISGTAGLIYCLFTKKKNSL